MLNKDRYKTAQERSEAFLRYCDCKSCECCELDDKRISISSLNDHVCLAFWLDLEAEEEKPLPCPCCGADAEIHYEDDVEREGDASVQCKGCLLMTPDYPSDVEAVMAWNKRMSN